MAKIKKGMVSMPDIAGIGIDMHSGARLILSLEDANTVLSLLQKAQVIYVDYSDTITEVASLDQSNIRSWLDFYSSEDINVAKMNTLLNTNGE